MKKFVFSCFMSVVCVVPVQPLFLDSIVNNSSHEVVIEFYRVNNRACVSQGIECVIDLEPGEHMILATRMRPYKNLEIQLPASHGRAFCNISEHAASFMRIYIGNNIIWDAVEGEYDWHGTHINGIWAQLVRQKYIRNESGGLTRVDDLGAVYLLDNLVQEHSPYTRAALVITPAMLIEINLEHHTRRGRDAGLLVHNKNLNLSI